MTKRGNESYLSQVRRFANDETREYLWRDLAIELVPALAYGLLYGWSVSGLVHGVLGFLVLFVAAYLVHFAHAPRALHQRLLANYESALYQLAKEKSRNAEARLVGRIDCLEYEVNWDLENYRIIKDRPLTLKMSVTILTTLWNDTPAGTTVSGFSLWVSWDGGESCARPLPIEGYSIQRTIPRSDGEWGFETIDEPLVGFPSTIEITNRNHQSGAVRFFARSMPSESHDEAMLRNDVKWRLYAHDRKQQRHLIYQGTFEGLRECGSVIQNNNFLWA
jgi:hypothetical protein